MLTYLFYNRSKDPSDLVGYVEFFFFVAPMFLLALCLDIVALAVCIASFFYFPLFIFIIITLFVYSILGLLYLKFFSE